MVSIWGHSVRTATPNSSEAPHQKTQWAVLTSINQLVAEPSGDDVQAGLHQAVRASIAPPFRTAIMIGQGGFQFQLCGSEFHRERRIKRPRLGSLFELLQHPLRLLHIEHGDGRVAEGTNRDGFQVEGRPTMGASHKLNILPQLLDLLSRQWMDEILFLQELEKADEVTVIVPASPISERHVSLHVVRQ